MFGIEVSQQAHDIMSVLQILGYPLVAWMWHRVGFEKGVMYTLDYLEDEGLMEFDDEENES